MASSNSRKMIPFLSSLLLPLPHNSNSFVNSDESYFLVINFSATWEENFRCTALLCHLIGPVQQCPDSLRVYYRRRWKRNMAGAGMEVSEAVQVYK
uniref:Uncharacterized protein n=1 Tax=Manihot esculenta TaxID=3983 RepID=A0A2C9V342_MANES